MAHIRLDQVSGLDQASARDMAVLSEVSKRAPSATTITAVEGFLSDGVVLELEYALPDHVEAVRAYLDDRYPGHFVVKATGPNA